MSPALRLSLGPRSRAVEPRSMMTSPSGTGRRRGLVRRQLGRLELLEVAPPAPGPALGWPASGHAATPTGGWGARRRAGTRPSAEAAGGAAPVATARGAAGAATGPTARRAAPGPLAGRRTRRRVAATTGGAELGRRPPMPGGGGIGRPLGPIGGRRPGRRRHGLARRAERGTDAGRCAIGGGCRGRRCRGVGRCRRSRRRRRGRRRRRRRGRGLRRRRDGRRGGGCRGGSAADEARGAGCRRVGRCTSGGGRGGRRGGHVAGRRLLRPGTCWQRRRSRRRPSWSVPTLWPTSEAAQRRQRPRAPRRARRHRHRAPATWPWLPSPPWRPSWRARAPRAGPAGATPRRRPCGGRGRPGRPRWRTSGS